MTYKTCLVAFLVVFLSVSSAWADTLSARVVGVHDGDTITVLAADKQSFRVRLVEIDVQGSDRYGRTLGRVHHGEMDVNAEMIRAGWAWAYRAYLTDEWLLALEEEARRNKRGLWSLPVAERIPPWEWRRKRR